MEKKDKLTLFDDLPLFEQVNQETDGYSDEQFGHAAYADTLLKVLEDNEKPLTIGLFGEWGTGKTTIVNMLLRKLKEKHNSTITPVLFNAWRHTGDSFRRQLLISVGKEAYGEDNQKYQELIDLTGITEKDLKAESPDDKELTWLGFWNEVKIFFRWLISPKLPARLTLIALILWVILVIVGIAVTAIWDCSFVNFLLTSLFVPIILVFFGVSKAGVRHKLIAQLNISQPNTDQPKLSYPEQFELEFDNCLNHLKGQRLLVIVDDLDRCEDNMVLNALSIIKQFTGKPNCVFIVPCDESQVLKAINNSDNEHDYTYESLRKFFDVSVRMDKILEFDLHNYTEKLVSKWEITPRIAEIAVYSGARDARKIKSFLNSFKTRHWILLEREESRYFEKGTTEKNLELIAKLSAIQEQFPKFYKELCEEPEVLVRIENVLKTKIDEDIKNDDVGNKAVVKLINENKILQRFLRNTIDIDLTDLSQILLGKVSEWLAEIPNGSRVENVLVEGDVNKFVEYSKEISSQNAFTLTNFIKKRLAKLISKDFQSQIRSQADCCIKLFEDQEAWAAPEFDKPLRRLADVLVDAIHENDKIHVKEIGDIKTVERILDKTSKQKTFASDIAKELIDSPLAEDSKDYLELVNKEVKLFHKKANGINSNLLKSEEDVIVKLLFAISKPDTKYLVPLPGVVNDICAKLDGADAACKSNQERCKLLRKYNDIVDIPQFFEKWKELIKAAASGSVPLEGNFELWLDNGIFFSKHVTVEATETLFPTIQSIWSHNRDTNIRSKLVTMLTHLYPILSQENKNTANINIMDWIDIQSSDEIDLYLLSLTEKDRTKKAVDGGDELQKLAIDILKHFEAWLKQQATSFDQRIEGICNLLLDFKKVHDDEKEKKEIVEIVLTKSPDKQFNNWNTKALGILIQVLPDNICDELGILTLEHISLPETSKVRREALLNLLAKHFVPNGLSAHNTDIIFNLLWDDHDETREQLCSNFNNLKKSMKNEDINRNIYAVLGDKARTANKNDITKRKTSIDILVENSSHLTTRESNDLADSTPRLIQSANDIETIKIGLQIVEGLENIGNLSNNVSSGIQLLLSHENDEIKELSRKILNKFKIVDNPDLPEMDS
jgi:hypothetical protein